MARHCKLPSILGEHWVGDSPNTISMERALKQIRQLLTEYGDLENDAVQASLDDLDFMIERIDA